MIHAQLNDDGVCIGFSNLARVESEPNLVFLPEGWNEDFLWRKWENGHWSTDKFEPVTPPETSVTIEARLTTMESALMEILLGGL